YDEFLIELAAGATDAGRRIHGVAAHGQVFFQDADLADRDFANVYTHPEIRYNIKLAPEVLSVLLYEFSCIDQCVQAMLCILYIIYPGNYYFVTDILIDPPVISHQRRRNDLNELAYEFKVFDMSQ